MFFGSQNFFKSVVAAHFAALGCWRTIDVGDRVGGIVFNDKREEYVKPQRNRKTVQQFLSNVSRFNNELGLTDSSLPKSNRLKNVLSRTNQLVSHDFLVVVLTDLYKLNESCLKELIQLRKNNDVIVATITDPLEDNLQFDEAVLSDGYNRLKVDKQTNLKKDYNKEIEVLKTTINADLKKYGIPHLTLNTQEKASNQLRAQLSSARRSR